MPTARKLSNNKAPKQEDLEKPTNTRFEVNRASPRQSLGGFNTGDTLGVSNEDSSYNTLNARSLNEQTREAYPQINNYRNLDSVHVDAKPRLSIDALRRKSYVAQSTEHDDEEDKPKLKGKVVKFGWLEGVLMRCLLNIWGVMLFLRLSWCIGQAGMLEGIGLITLANIVTFITGLSMSAVSTNGQIKGGGIYYMISRSLGPEFGAAIGLMFTVANSIAVSLHLVGFCEAVNDLLAANDWGSVVGGGANAIRVVGIGTLICILVLVFVGMDWVTRAQMSLFVVLIAAQVNFMVGSFIGPGDNDERKARGFIGYNSDTFNTNLWSDYRTGYKDDPKQQSFFTIFGVFFPSVTGIVAGANLSGDLKDPASAIPKGTLLAISTTYISYIIFTLMLGGVALREATGDVTQYQNNMNDTFMAANPTYPLYTDCKNGHPLIPGEECEWGLFNSAQVMELVSSWGPLIYMGCFAATLSSAIASLVGAPRVLQALAKDRLYPLMHFFAKGYGANNDPVRGYILVFLLALGCLLIADLNALAPLLSNFFLMAYFLINFSCFHASISKSPGWRPSFKYYNRWVSLLGCVLCIAVMFLMNWITALITVFVVSCLTLYVRYRKVDVNWGSSTQAQAFNSALTSMQSLSEVKHHVKNYRPQILVFSGMPSSRPTLLQFANLIVKNLSLMLCAQIEKGPYNQKGRIAMTKKASKWMTKNKLKGFYQLIEEESFEIGARSILQINGLGKLRANMILLGFKSNWRSCKRDELNEYFNVISEAFDRHMGVAILRLQEGLDYSDLIKEVDDNTPIPEPKGQDNKAFDRSDSVMSTLSNSNDEEIDSSPESPAKETKTENKKRKKSISDKYTTPEGSPVPREVLNTLQQFHQKQKKGTIDVWWLYDDGGLSLLIPYILKGRQQFAGNTLRIFTLASSVDELDQGKLNMAALLAKFRIEFSDVIAIPDITSKAEDSTKEEFEELIRPFMGGEDGITQADLVAHKERTNRHLRLRELVLKHSTDATMVVMTLPMPRKGTVSAPMYLAWLDLITKGMPPFLLVRGNQEPVLTYYS